MHTLPISSPRYTGLVRINGFSIVRKIQLQIGLNVSIQTNYGQAAILHPGGQHLRTVSDNFNLNNLHTRSLAFMQA